MRNKVIKNTSVDALTEEERLLPLSKPVEPGTTMEVSTGALSHPFCIWMKFMTKLVSINALLSSVLVEIAHLVKREF
jgi:uncharacterized ion transporter superfamily protein YfcC